MASPPMPPGPALEPLGLSQGSRMGDGRAEITGLAIRDSAGRPVAMLRTRESARFDLGVHFHADLQEPHIGVCLRDVHGRILVGAHTMYDGLPLGPVVAGQHIVVSFELPVLLNPGKYLLMLGVAEHEGRQVYRDCDTIFDYREIEVVGEERAWGVVNVAATARLLGDAGPDSATHA